MKINSDQIFRALLLNASQLAAGFFTSDFELREHGGSYSSISNTPQILVSGNRGSFDIGVDHRILLGSNYRPGDYGLEVVYTIMPK